MRRKINPDSHQVGHRGDLNTKRRDSSLSLPEKNPGYLVITPETQ
jgi:hypothetical protein